MEEKAEKQESNQDNSNAEEENYSLLLKLIWKQSEGVYLQYLLNLLGPGHFIASTEMSMSPVTIYHILNDIALNDKTKIIEFGSGNSTIFVAALLNKLNLKATFFSVDDDDNWIENIKQSLLLNGISKVHVEFIHAPIKRTTQFDAALSPFFNWYDTNILKTKIGDEKFDLVIVDGPNGALCPFSRFPAVPFLTGHLANSYSLYLDDTDRPEEKAILKKWSMLLEQDISFIKQKYGNIVKNAKYYTHPK